MELREKERKRERDAIIDMRTRMRVTMVTK